MKSAESLFKQGKAEAALTELQALAKSAGGDLPTLNRIGDLLARHGKAGDAVQHYLRIAAKFTEQGFYPKAVAIHKKVLRLDANNTDCLIRLGELYVNQKLPGEARDYFEQAARALGAGGEFAEARAVYERLVEAEPSNLENRSRLAEARAAEGEGERAGEEFLVVGESFLGVGKSAEAERAFRRAEELLPDRREPLLGIADALAADDRGDEALALLEQAEDDPDGLVVGARTLHYERAGRYDDAAAQLARPGATEIGNATFRRIFEHHLAAGTVDDAWSRYSDLFAGWSGNQGSVRTIALLTDLCDLEEQGHVPALQRLYDMLKVGNNRASIVQTLERLVAAYRARSMHDEASLMLDELKAISPKSSSVRKAASARSDGSEKAQKAPDDAADAAGVSGPREPGAQPAAAGPGTEEGNPDHDAEAPAVPLNRSDEEFVTGRLTQAEILEKYGLQGQALDQVNEVVKRFPGHEKAQHRLVTLLRGEGDPDRLRQALVGLAIARRASGDTGGAKKAADEARQLGTMDESTARLLGRLGLVVEQTPETDSVDEAEPAIVPTAHNAGAATEKPAPSTGGALVIDLDALEEMPDEEAEAAVEDPAPRPGRRRIPGDDMLKEISGFLDAGKAKDAAKSVENLRALGYASSELDELAERVRQAADQPAAIPPEPTPAPPAADGATEGLTFSEDEIAEIAGAAPAGPLAGLDEDDDLSTITAALESELFSEEESGAAPAAAESEQSLGEVFAAFKQHVEQEVGADDYRTHYNLGIAYKEMGLMDEALIEFEISVRSPELFREACAMLAMCHREREEIEKAVDWYRQALDADDAEETELSGLRYDLADVLLLSGDRDAALDMFRNVLQSDPSFRDVEDRVADLESGPAT